MKALFHQWVLGSLCFFTMACGWHLKGAYQLPPEMATTYVASSIQTSELVRQLNRNLRSARVKAIDYLSDTVAVLKVSSQSGSRTLSIGSDGKALEYEIYSKVRFSLNVPGSSFSVKEQEITLLRDQVFDPLDVLAANKEGVLLQKDMERQLAGMILDRISAAYANYESDSEQLELDVLHEDSVLDQP